MRARDLVFHLHCFTCTWCNAPLDKGDTFGLRDDLVYCRPHYETLARDTAPYFSPEPPPSLAAEDGGNAIPPSAHCLTYDGATQAAQLTATGRKGRPRKKRNGEMAGADAMARHGSGKEDRTLELGRKIFHAERAGEW